MLRGTPFPPPMVDMHSHILPGVDDGASNLSDALSMLQHAVRDGVMMQVLTPHVHERRYPGNTRTHLEERFREFLDIVRGADIPIDLHLAGEVRIGPGVRELVESDSLPWLGEWSGHKTFLLEFPMNSVPAGAEDLVLWLRKAGTLPIIVHPERNLVFQKLPEKLRPYLEMDCPLQITAGSLTGRFGRPAQKLAAQLLKDDRVSAIASDAHNLKYRPPNLGKGVRAAAKLVGKTRAAELVTSGVFDLLMGDQHRIAS